MIEGGPVLIMAGGTGGHIFPGLAVAEVLRERGIPVAWLGAQGGMESRLVPQHGIPLHALRIKGLRGKGWRARLGAPWMLCRSLWQVIRVLRQVRPRSVLSMGGYVAGPGGVAAWLLRLPLVVHEQNRLPGLTNRMLAYLANRVLTGFEATLASHSGQQWVGNPVRSTIAALPAPAVRFNAHKQPPRLLVLGGSLGARSLNTMLPKALAVMQQPMPEILHQSGQRGLAEAQQAYAEAGMQARVEPFIEDMDAAYAWADLCVCRAGALTIAELCSAGLGALLVPYPHAVDDHQTCNAEVLQAVGAAQIMQESEMTISGLAEQLGNLLGSLEGLELMAERARTLARPHAAEQIANVCLEVTR